MADEPTTPAAIPTAQDVANLEATTDAANKASEALGIMNSIGFQAKNVFGEFDSKLKAFGISLQTTGSLTESQASAFGLLSTAILGARKSFEGLANIDTSGLDTFKGQWQDLANLVDGSPLGQTALSSMKKIAEMGGKTKDEISKMSLTSLTNFGNSFLESADNGLRLQNAIIQLSAKTGNLNEVFKAAGPGLENINLLLQQQQKSLSDTAGATGLSAKQVEQYYSQLGSIPKALTATVSSHEEAGKSVSLLTASIQVAKGTGRSYADVVEDLHTAFRDYNLTGEKALQFTARMSELSSKFGVELGDVQNNLRETAGMFKMFGDNAEGAAKMMNSYLGELTKTGISGRTAMEVMNGMTQGIKGMSLAQKSFLSAQTGGAGGLMGGFQIEKMLRDGKIDEVFDKVRQSMKKQMGSIVTLDDAQNSPQAAAQMTKQMMMLQQGPLGKFAKDDQTAMRILEAFKSRDAGGPAGDLSKSIVQDTMATGVDIQEKSLTELSRIRELLQTNQSFANVANLTTMQHSNTAGVGAPINSPAGDYNRDNRDNLKEYRARSSFNSGDSAGMIGDGKDISGTFSSDIINNYKAFINEIGPALKGPVNKIKDLLQSGKGDEAAKSYQGFLGDIEKRKAELKNAPLMARTSGLEGLNREEMQMKSAYANLVGSNGQTKDQLPKVPDMTMNFGNASDAVNKAANRASSVPMAGNNQAAQTGPGQRGTQQVNSEITVQVEGFCLSCGDKIKNTQQRKSVSVTSDMEK